MFFFSQTVQFQNTWIRIQLLGTSTTHFKIYNPVHILSICTKVPGLRGAAAGPGEVVRQEAASREGEATPPQQEPAAHHRLGEETQAAARGGSPSELTAQHR